MTCQSAFSLENKVIIVTGASSGIGRQCAVSFSQSGARVVLVGRNEERLKETLHMLSGNNHLEVVTDITKYSELENIVDRSVNMMGKINGFVHCAGMEITRPLNVMNSVDYERLFAVNVISALEFIRIISKRKYYSEESCSMILLSSVLGFLGEIACSGYTASKGAVISAVKALALELAPKKIRVNSVSPGQISDTAMTKKMLDIFTEKNTEDRLSMYPLGFGKPEDVANACIYLLAESGQWITGTNLVVDGGYSAK